MLHEYHGIYSARYYPRFHITAVSLGTYSPLIRGHYSVCVRACVCVRRKANYIGHILRRNCLLKHVVEGKIEGKIAAIGIRGRRSKQLLGDLKKGHCKLKKEALDCTLWRTRFGRGYGPVVRQTTE
jgi:hypothetical protein